MQSELEKLSVFGLLGAAGRGIAGGFKALGAPTRQAYQAAGGGLSGIKGALGASIPVRAWNAIPGDAFTKAFMLHSGYTGYQEGGLEEALKRGIGTGVSTHLMMRGGAAARKYLQKDMMRRGMFQRTGPGVLAHARSAIGKRLPESVQGLGGGRVGKWFGKKLDYSPRLNTGGKALSFGLGDIAFGTAAGMAGEHLSHKYLNPIGSMRNQMQEEDRGLNALRRTLNTSVY